MSVESKILSTLPLKCIGCKSNFGSMVDLKFINAKQNDVDFNIYGVLITADAAWYFNDEIASFDWTSSGLEKKLPNYLLNRVLNQILTIDDGINFLFEGGANILIKSSGIGEGDIVDFFDFYDQAIGFSPAFGFQKETSMLE